MKIVIIIILFFSTIAFGLTQLDTENADRNLTSQVTVLTHTPSATLSMQCQGLIYFGDGSKNLSGRSSTFEITVTVGGQTIQPNPQYVFVDTSARSAIYTPIFPVPANSQVLLKVRSPVSTDTDVDVTAYLYSTSPSVGEIADAVWDETASDHTTADTFGELVNDINDIISILEVIDTTVSDANDANSFTLTAGDATDDAYWGNIIYVQDADDNHWESRMIIEWTSSRVVLVDEYFTFTPAVSDRVVIWAFYVPPYIYNNLPYRDEPETIDVDYRVVPAGGSTGGTRTLDPTGDDPP